MKMKWASVVFMAMPLAVQASDLHVAGVITASDYIRSGTYVQAIDYVYTNMLRVGGGTASGSFAAVIGQNPTTSSYSSFVVGHYNLDKAKDGTTSPNPTAWSENDPLFVVGNGTGNAADPVNVKNRNAFIVYKDGTITMSKPQGDIPMGQFGN